MAPPVRTTTSYIHLRVTPNGGDLQDSILRLNGIQFDTSIARLGRNIFVHRVPCHSLDIVRVIRNFADTGSSSDRENSGSVVGGSSQNVLGSRRPSQVINFAGSYTERRRKY